ncbi:MAG: isoprenylcysteine carboxylmethyltransferase family protein [Pirellulaceae bacterium]
MRWLRSTSRRTFAVYPFAIMGIELALRGGTLPFLPWGILLLLWGYLQYRLGGDYRTKHGGGGPGIDVPPERIVDTGIYRYIRNPMYLGHMIFMAGLTVTFESWAALALLVFHLYWFDARVREDEAHLEQLFGAAYRAYVTRTKRWIPFVY